MPTLWISNLKVRSKLERSQDTKLSNGTSTYSAYKDALTKHVPEMNIKRVTNLNVHKAHWTKSVRSLWSLIVEKSGN